MADEGNENAGGPSNGDALEPPPAAVFTVAMEPEDTPNNHVAMAVAMETSSPVAKTADSSETETRRRRINVDRILYDEVTFDEGFKPCEEESTPLSERFKTCCSCNPKTSCSRTKLLAYTVKYLPFVRILLKYRVRDYFLGDLFAGITVGIMHIPQGMAYAMLAALSPVYGLYTSFFPVLFYSIFGSSRHVSVGTFAIASLMVGSAVDKQMASVRMNISEWAEIMRINNSLAGGADGYGTGGTGLAGIVPTEGPTNEEDELFLESVMMQEKIKIAACVGLLSGCVVLLMGLLQLGWLAVYLSEPLVSGFTTGAACHVLTSQIKHVFGITVTRVTGAGKLPKIYVEIFSKLGQTNVAALVTSLICMSMIIITKECINNRYKKKLPMPIPIELVVVVLGTVASHYLELHQKFHIKVVGDIPTGIPAPRLPEQKYMTGVVGDSIAAGIICYAISVSMAKILAKKHRYDIDSNQEMLAYGITNILSSFFSCYLAAASLSRSLIQSDMGGHTQITGLVSSLVVLIVLLVVGPLFYSLPNCVLASIIMVALKGMFLQFLDLKRLWRVSKYDFSIWLVSFLATALLDVDLGLAVALAYSILTVIARSQKPRAAMLGRIGETDLYVSTQKYKQAQEIPGIRIFRYNSSLYFANAENFKTRLYSETGANPVRLALKRAKVTSKRRKADKAREREERKQERELKKLGKPSSEGQSTSLELPSITITPDMSASTNHLEHVVNKADNNGNGALANGKPPSDFIDWPRFKIHHVIIDCSLMAYIDSVGAKCLKSVVTEYHEADVSVYLCHLQDDVRLVLGNIDFFAKGGLAPKSVFMSTHDAVMAALSHPNVQTTRLTAEPSPQLQHVASTVSFDNLSVSQIDDDSASNAERCRLMASM